MIFVDHFERGFGNPPGSERAFSRQETVGFALVHLGSFAWQGGADDCAPLEQPCLLFTVPSLHVCCAAGHEPLLQVSHLSQHVLESLRDMNMVGYSTSLFLNECSLSSS